jgi:arylsulfatase A-like enzyme
LRGKYRLAVGDVDRAVAALLEMLEEEGLLEGSLVVFTSDHGERLGERHFVEGRPTHTGNPSFAEVLEVPLVVWPARFAVEADEQERLVGGTDLFNLLLTFAGLAEVPETTLRSGETFTSELHWLTYQRGPWKSYTRRDDRALWLVDLGEDPAEKRSVAAENPHVAALHWERVTGLVEDLAVPKASSAVLSPRDAARLRALGYLAPTDAPATEPGLNDPGSASAEQAYALPSKKKPAAATEQGGWRPARGLQ